MEVTWKLRSCWQEGAAKTEGNFPGPSRTLGGTGHRRPRAERERRCACWAGGSEGAWWGDVQGSRFRPQGPQSRSGLPPRG